MVKLIVDNFAQVSLLETALNNSEIEYHIEIETKPIGIPTPYLLVHGAALGMEQALKYIEGYTKHE